MGLGWVLVRCVTGKPLALLLWSLWCFCRLFFLSRRSTSSLARSPSCPVNSVAAAASISIARAAAIGAPMLASEGGIEVAFVAVPSAPSVLVSATQVSAVVTVLVAITIEWRRWHTRDLLWSQLGVSRVECPRKKSLLVLQLLLKLLN